LAETSTEGKAKQTSDGKARARRLTLIFGISVLLILPCFWHERIEAGDLASHAYNAWLAQLVKKGQAPGLYRVRQWSNVLFDVTLLQVSNLLGFSAAQKVVVSLCVLVFFWGVFFLISSVTQREPWFLTPCMAMLAYGYSFSMGFMNYYLSIGLACIALGAAWNGGVGNWLIAAGLAPFVYLAHPIGFLWLIGTLAYRVVRQRVPAWWKAALPIAGVAPFVVAHWYLVHRVSFPVDWSGPPLYLRTGADQLILYGSRYEKLSWAALAFGCFCVVVELVLRWRERGGYRELAVPVELYAVTLCAAALLPENLQPPMYAGWIGLLVSRLTTIAAIWGLCVLANLKRRKWHLAGFGALALGFFGFLYQDTAWLNRLESNAETIVSRLPYGTRIISMIDADPSWRVQFIGHIGDRACIGRCFTYSNYEPPSGQFRLRVSKQGSPIVTSSEDDSEDMEGGGYEIQETDPPLRLLYQCDKRDLTRLCLHDLEVGENTGQFGPD
jgi:hypothetical protein